MRGITDQDFLGAIRAGVYKDWDESAFRAELCSPDRIDGVRPLVAAPVGRTEPRRNANDPPHWEGDRLACGCALAIARGRC